ncbi:Translocon-associated protein subunit alpha [Monoraphidium neglectum]|uniref:Translocon-associated protein subunit alpha n=1 Tax=Monoraphidium neglectum TaxID=145388 RepID=A0A0D2MSB0_9CHLO|nr:Translocon-associated protein subunit alpha [Monoraphidium neglectum]KIZ03292.1 Translocon-associated protein subunit alpha [Monoraphidium neglectum]|eukprot:XP_013902311.1 Translocon-associated protein subunit alpha [Monoraphidium neglectum]
MRTMQICLLAAVLALVVPGSTAQRPGDLLGNLPPAGELSVAHYFPEHPDKQFPAGDIISVVVSGHNTGAKPMNLSAIVGSINSPEKYEMFIQNFTIGRYFAPLAPGAEASIEYKFRADPILGSTPAREFIVALHLFYEVEGSYFSTTFFNQTVDITEAPKLVDTDLIWLVGTLLAGLGAAGYFAFTKLSEKLGLNKGKAKKAKKAEGPVTIDEDDWVKGTHYEVQKRRRAAAAKKA